MDERTTKMLKGLSPNKVIIPITLGLVAVLAMALNNDALDIDAILDYLADANPIWVVGAVLVLLARDFGYMYRIRHLTNTELNWTSSFFIVVLWEFASAVTPSVVGGTAVAVFILNKEGLPFGRSLAYVMLTAVFDNMFFVFASMAVLIFVPDLFPKDQGLEEFAANSPLPMEWLFGISVGLIALYSTVMLFGLLIKPRGFKWLMIKITSLPFLRRWRYRAMQSGNDMILASNLLKGNNPMYWIKTILSTIFIWSARYLLVNFLIAAFTGLSLLDHIQIFSKQIIMWIVMLISPTPGSSGAAEYFFKIFFDHYFTVAGFSIVVALFWRLFTYYAYLILGVICLPRWLKRVLTGELDKF